MKSGAIFALGFSVTLLSGCFVCSETEFPKARPVALDKGREVTVQLSGFDAVVTTYVPVYEYGTVFAGRPMSCRRRPVCYTATYANQTYVPQSSTTTAFAERAAETFEKGGYVLQSGQVRRTVRFRRRQRGCGRMVDLHRVYRRIRDPDLVGEAENLRYRERQTRVPQGLFAEVRSDSLGAAAALFAGGVKHDFLRLHAKLVSLGADGYRRLRRNEVSRFASAVALGEFETRFGGKT